MNTTQTSNPEPSCDPIRNIQTGSSSTSAIPDNSAQLTANQTSAPLPDPGQGWTEPGQPLPNTGQPLPDPGQPLPPDDAKSAPEPKADENPPSAESILALVQDPQRNEMELADMLDGFSSDRERLAEIASVLKGGPCNRPRIELLSAEQQEIVFQLLQVHSARAISKLLALPEPVGLNFKISKTALCAFRNHHRARQAEREKLERLKSLEEIIDAENGESAFQRAAERILKLRILRAGNGDEEDLDALVTTFAKFRKLVLAERKQIHTEQAQRLRSLHESLNRPSIQ